MFGPAAEALGWASLLDGDLDEAHNFLRGIWQNIEARRSDPRLIYGLSIVLERRGETDLARDLRTAALQAQPDLEEWFALFEQTTSLMRQLNAREPETGPGTP
jgi:hypothetical protein